jgi:hypothetical protein
VVVFVDSRLRGNDNLETCSELPEVTIEKAIPEDSPALAAMVKELIEETVQKTGVKEDPMHFDINPALREHVLRLLRSFKHWTGRDLLPALGSNRDAVQRLFEAPLVVISHGTEDDPILNYGNKAALELWEMPWETFTRTPSRLTAEPVSREERDALLAEVTKKGFIDHYRGIRISRTGRRFRIEGATVWNILDEHDRYAGQAAAFERWVAW